jgi:glycolate oxidase iron-sulfur subunit
LSNDPQYAAKAARVSALCKDISEILVNEDLSILTVTPPGPLVFHSPCTLQHGQKLNGVVERLLERLGFQLLPVSDAHLCCGSAGTYSILQKDLSQQLRANKLKALQADNPVVVATANIGCLTHLQSGTPTPVRHWIEVLDAACS